MEDPFTIQLNGSPRTAVPGTTVTALLADLGFDGQPVLVERNGTALFPRDFSAILLSENDSLEIIRIVAGG